MARYCSRVLLAAAVGLGFTCAASGVEAAEFGFNIYPTGTITLGAGATPPPGFYVTAIAGYYQGDVGGNVNVGRVIAVDLKAKIFTAATNLLYVSKEEVLGGHLGLSVNLPVGYVDLKAQATIGPFSGSREVNGWGLGDTMVRGQLGWTNGPLSHTIYLSGWLPTGRYDPTFAPNVGLHRPAADVTWAVTYIEPTTKLEFSGAAGITLNAVNTETDYRTGTESHFEWAIGKHFGETLSLGVAGYHYIQLTGDSGSGATLGSFEGRNNGIGPALNYATQIGGHVTVLSLRHYWEYESSRHFEGTLSTANLTVRF